MKKLLIILLLILGFIGTYGLLNAQTTTVVPLFGEGIGTTTLRGGVRLGVQGDALIAGSTTVKSIIATSSIVITRGKTGIAFRDLQGTSNWTFNQWAGQRYEIAVGTAVDPVTLSGPIFKLSKTENIASTTCGGNIVDNECNGAFFVNVINTTTSEMQTNAIQGIAETISPISGDAVGIIGGGRVSGSGVGAGTGAYLFGRRDTTTGNAVGAEIRVDNITDDVSEYNGMNGYPGLQGISVTPNWTDAACGVCLGGNLNGGRLARWNVGFAAAINSVATTTFRDDSSAEESVRLAGSHNYGLIIQSGAGRVAIGTSTSPSASTFYVKGGKIAIESNSTGFGQFQLANPDTSQTTFAIVANASPATIGGNLIAVDPHYAWEIGMGPYGAPLTDFAFANAYTGKPLLSISSDTGSTTIVGQLNVSGTATSTFVNGINLRSGCFAINNSCVSGGAGGGSPGGSDTQIQYNNAGSFGGTNIVYDAGTGAFKTIDQPLGVVTGFTASGFGPFGTGNCVGWKITDIAGATQGCIAAAGNISTFFGGPNNVNVGIGGNGNATTSVPLAFALGVQGSAMLSNGIFTGNNIVATGTIFSYSGLSMGRGGSANNTAFSITQDVGTTTSSSIVFAGAATTTITGIPNAWSISTSTKGFKPILSVNGANGNVGIASSSPGASFVVDSPWATSSAIAIFTRDLQYGASTQDGVTIFQGNNAQFAAPNSLFVVNNQDTDSNATAMVELIQAANGTALNIVSAANGVTIAGASTGTSLNISSGATSGTGILFSGVGSQTSGTQISFTGNTSGSSLTSYSGNILQTSQSRTLTGGSAVDTGSYLNLLRNNQSTDGTFRIMGDILKVESRCLQNGGRCIDGSNLISARQNATSSPGHILSVIGASETGDLATFEATSTGSGSGVQISIGTTSPDRFALKITTGGTASTTALFVNANGNVGIGTTTATTSLRQTLSVQGDVLISATTTSGTLLATSSLQVGNDGKSIKKIYSGSATLDFANLVSIGCEDLTMTATGAVTGDTVALGVPNASIVANSNFSAWVSSNDTVSVRFCALISGDPASGTFNVVVMRP